METDFRVHASVNGASTLRWFGFVVLQGGGYINGTTVPSMVYYRIAPGSHKPYTALTFCVHCKLAELFVVAVVVLGTVLLVVATPLPLWAMH